MTPHVISAVVDLQGHSLGSTFTARGVRGTVDLNPFINIDLAEMTGPVFSVHPHAGFSVATYAFEDSTTRFANRDSLGDRSRVEGGGMRWTVSGSGIVHDEFVEEPGRLGHGAQIFVRTPAADELVDPYGTTLGRNELPVVQPNAGARVRVAAGSAWEEKSGLVEPTGVRLLDVTLDPGATLELPVVPTHRGFLMVVAGSGHAQSPSQRVTLGPTAVASFEQGEGSILLEAGPGGLQVLTGSGVPIDGPAYMHGGFCMSRQDRVVDAIGRYQRGELNGLIDLP